MGSVACKIWMIQVSWFVKYKVYVPVFYLLKYLWYICDISKFNIFNTNRISLFDNFI